jgi:exodeoxyribonuclease V alpha subunit
VKGAGTVTWRLRVATIRSRKKNGVIFTGYALGGGTANSSAFVVKARGPLCAEIQVGDLWEVTGAETERLLALARPTRHEKQIEATELWLVKPSGSQIVQWLATHKEVVGIGAVKAQRLWDVFGEELYKALDRGEAEPLLRVIRNPDVVANLLAVWARDGDAKTLRWMQQHRIPLDLSRKVLRFHSTAAVEKMQEDPYRLLSFSAAWTLAAWTLVDEIARAQLRVAPDDPRRLRAAVEQVLYTEMDNGHTTVSKMAARAPLVRLLGNAALAQQALGVALKNRSIVEVGDTYYSAGAWIMERTVAEFIHQRVAASYQPALFDYNLDELISAYEREEAVESGRSDFWLNEAQRTAVKRSFEQAFSVITGGAGVGKTTVLKALYRLLDTTGLPRFQMALSGRAAKRMQEATGESAYTIAAFLSRVTTEQLGDTPVIVIDEASMVDLPTMYRLVRKLPEHCRMILVGDPFQLPPIGAGLVLHCLTDLPVLPLSELTIVRRQSADSAIPRFAAAIRTGIWPDKLRSDPNGEVAVIPCEPHRLINTVLALYDIDRENTQLLSATRANPFAGFEPISRACSQRYTAGRGAPPLSLHGEPTGYYEGDLLLYTRNDWQRDLQNGLLGRLVEVFDTPHEVSVDDSKAEFVEALGWVDWEGRLTPLLASDVEWIDYGYAISVHKAQGSQFKRVIMPVTRSRLLDRTLLYTAITRAQKQVILVGDVAAMRQAAQDRPIAHRRRVALPAMLDRRLSQRMGAE